MSLFDNLGKIINAAKVEGIRQSKEKESDEAKAAIVKIDLEIKAHNDAIVLQTKLHQDAIDELVKAKAVLQAKIV